MRTTFVAAGVAAAAILLGAAAPAKRMWAHRPTNAQLEAAWPSGAAKRGEPGRAAMMCKVRDDGGVGDCTVKMESPAGAGFGPALLALAGEYKLDPAAPRALRPGQDVLVQEEWYRFDTPAGWLRRPTSEDLMQVWPTKAWAKGLGGQATINCLVSPQGALFDCVTTAETPPGEHFGDAAIALSSQFLMKPATLKGQPVVSPVNVPINFVMPGGSRGFTSDLNSLRMVAATQAWLDAPSYANVAAAYPAKAREAKLGGRATLDCALNREGRLTACSTITEEPRRQGFAEAAKMLAKEFRATTTTSDGKSIVGAHVQLPMVFDPAMLAGQQVIGKAQWAGLPSAEETDAAFGKLAVTGTVHVMLTCVVQQGGHVTDCKVEREDPAGQGVAAAALSLAPYFRLTTWTSEGLPTVGGTIGIPLRYEGAKPDAPKG